MKRTILSIIVIIALGSCQEQETDDFGNKCEMSLSVYAFKVSKQSWDNVILNDGKCEAVVKNGTPPYNYNWSNGGTSKAITNLSVGTYSVTVTDANGCQKSGEAKVECCTIIYPPTF